jgi:hypothetical protein
VRDDNAGDGGGEVGSTGGGEHAREVQVAAVVLVPHVHAAVEHDALPADGRYDAALPDFLPRTCNRANSVSEVPMEQRVRRRKRMAPP